ncbi:MAG: hypothetical protein VB933_00435 [Pseudomonadales bacterium]
MISSSSSIAREPRFVLFQWRENLSRTNKLWLLCVVAPLLTNHAIGALGSDSVATESAIQPTDTFSLNNVNDTNEALEIAKDQIETGEYEEAIRLAESEIGRTEALWGRYDSALVEPLLVLGDGLAGYGDYDNALNAYDRALHVTRVNAGLHDPAQVAVVYREANAHYAKGDIATANDRHEYAYHVLERNFDQRADEIALIPGTFVLADWYSRTYNIFMARTFYEKARALAQTHYGDGHPILIQALRGIASTYRLEKFRPAEIPNIEAIVASRRKGSARDLSRLPPTRINNFREGETALIEIVKMLIAQSDADIEEIATAKLDLADWYLLFQQNKRAQILYEDVWISFDSHSSTAFIDRELRSPKPIYLALPQGPKTPTDGTRTRATKGFVELSFTVNKRGSVTNLVTEHAEPPGSDFLVRKQARKARYRPAFEDGRAVITPDVRITHTFTYYPGPLSRGGSNGPDR